MSCAERNTESVLVTSTGIGDDVKETFRWLMWPPKLSRALEYCERYVGQLSTGLGVGVILLFLAAIYVTPALGCVNNGTAFAWMSNEPLRMDDSPFRHRILAPLIAHYLYLRGASFIYFPLLLTVIFLASIYVFFRREGHTRLIAFIASSTMAFSGPVLFLLHFQGYTDILTHLLLFWCFALRRSTLVWVVPLALSSLNHEATLFSIPWIVLLRTRYYTSSLFSWRGILRLMFDSGLAALSVVPMLLMRKFWPLQNAQLAPDFYLSLVKTMWEMVLPYAGIGIFEAFKLFWFIPLIAIYFTKRGERLSTFAVFALMFAAGAGQLFFSHDISRHVGHAFPIVLYGLELLSKRKVFDTGLAELLMAIVLCNFFVPQYYIGQRNAWPFLPSPVSFVFWMLGFDPWQFSFMPWG